MICPIMSKNDLDTANCRTDCKWYCDGECAIKIIALASDFLAEKKDEESEEK